ncbi:mitochondrial 2-enoyl thioester reductase [Schaereria dolodes]|nr:mitochondrial 2-enoyl thioester reductase [Schaereria dolodes]
MHKYSIPPPYSTLLTLRTLAAPLNPADINQMQGRYPSLPPFTSNLGTPFPSAVPGNEACFEVLSTGSAAPAHIRQGDWVIANQANLGTWRTHLQTDATCVLRVEKEGLQAEQVATVGVNSVTAWRLLRDFVELDADRGDWVVLNGANSGVGRVALQLAKRWGWRTIAEVRDRPGEEGMLLRKELQELGATKVVMDEEMRERGFADRVKEWTRGGREKVKLGLNCVGGKHATAMAGVLSQGAHMVTYGAMSKQAMKVSGTTLIFKNVVFHGFWLSRWSDAHPEEKIKTVEELLGMIREGTLQDVPIVKVPWGWETHQTDLVDAVQGTLEGYKKGKGVFVFGDS